MWNGEEPTTETNTIITSNDSWTLGVTTTPRVDCDDDKDDSGRGFHPFTIERRRMKGQRLELIIPFTSNVRQ